MNNISSIAGVSAAAKPYLADLSSLLQGSFGKSVKDFQAVGAALQAGDVSSAKSALALLQKDLQTGAQAGASQLFGTNTQANTDFQKLTSALQANNLTGAQTAFASLQSDLTGGLSGSSTTDSAFGKILNSLMGGALPVSV